MTCQICQKETNHYFDTVNFSGQWCYMCPDCFKAEGHPQLFTEFKDGTNVTRQKKNKTMQKKYTQEFNALKTLGLSDDECCDQLEDYFGN